MTEPGGRAPAPGELRLVQLFINTLDIEGGTEDLDTPAALSAWLYANGLTRIRVRVTRAGLDRARRIRELLRALVLANNGIPLGDDVMTELNSEFSALPLVAAVDRDEHRLEPAGRGIDGALGRIAAIVVLESVRGRWRRLKGCVRDVCHWAFYDHSRSGSGTWCTMAICGSRTKATNYYRRQHPSASRRPSLRDIDT
jgi:predicted RNA-binding Zn ribbon-like protein